jgi:hypothetical protein
MHDTATTVRHTISRRLLGGGLGAAVLLAVIVVAATAGQSTARHAASRPSRHERLAFTVATRMLADVVLPTGSVPVPSRKASGGSVVLRYPVDRLFFAAQIDRHQFWTTPASPLEVIASVKQHRPAGAKLSGSGSSGVLGQPAANAFIAFALPKIDSRVLGVRQIAIDAIDTRRGRTAVRVDSEVQYLAPRKPDQAIPRSARWLQITMRNASFSDGYPPNTGRVLLSTIVSKPSLVRQIAGWVNALPFAGNFTGAAFSCGLAFGTDSFTFRATATGQVLGLVSEAPITPTTPDPCLDGDLWIRGHPQPDLADGGVLLHRTDALLRINLTAEPHPR